MASYISNWADNITNLDINSVSTNFVESFILAGDWLNSTSSSSLYITSLSSSSVAGGFFGGGTFQMWGRGFTTSNTPTITKLSIQTPQSWMIDYYGSITVSSSTETGYISHVAIHSPTGEDLDIVGAMSLSSNDMSISSFTFHALDGSIIEVKGAFTYHDLNGTTTGNLTSFGYTDSFGHSYKITGLSVQYQLFDAFVDADSFVAEVMSGNDIIAGTANVDVLKGFAGNDTLNGGAGADTLVGGIGNDTYVVDNAVDTVIEGVDEGTDLVKVDISVKSGSYALEDNVENAKLINTVAYTLIGNGLDNELVGNSAVNVLIGDLGNDTLDGGAGIDTLEGGDGDDTYIVDVIGDVIVDTGGIDTVIAKLTAGTYWLDSGLENLTLGGTAAINATGNADNNILTGNAAANALNGAGGVDTLIGGDGNDIYIVDSLDDTVTETNGLAAGGVDIIKSSVDWTLGANIENLTLTGMDNLTGIGNTLVNTITGNEGDNTLDGGAGVDKLMGGLGNDTYIVDITATGKLQDAVTEAANAGTDNIQLRGNFVSKSGVNLTLAANFENLDASLTGISKLGLKGNALDNTLTGNDFHNLLDGGVGADTLIGGIGDDYYVVDNVGDVVVENVDEGFDQVQVSIASVGGSYTLADNIEVGFLFHTGILGLNGNDLDNGLFGNAAANVLVGNGGNDSLDGGSGADIMQGGSGHDNYVVDNAADIVDESDGHGGDAGGYDRVQSKISYMLASYVEELWLGIDMTSTAAINGTGNALGNIIFGNNGANVLDGAAGDDQLDGAAGNDTLIGGLGADRMNGGDGSDTYVVDSVGDVVVEDSAGVAGGVDLVQSSVSFDLSNNLNGNLLSYVENLTLTGTDNLTGTGNTLVNVITGNSGSNVLDGGAGIDKLMGGLGSDTYIVDLTSIGGLQDIVTEAENAGTDTIQLRGASSNVVQVMLTLGANLENLDASLTTTSKLNITGNKFINILTGNAEDNLLDGGANSDTLYGGAGNDTYIVDNFGDTVIENVDEGIDLVKINIVSVGGFYSLADNVESGSLINTVAFDLYGNDMNNSLTGNAAVNSLFGYDGNDVLIGNGGNDILNGGFGNDILIGGTGNDSLTGGDEADTFVFNSALSATTNKDVITDFVTGVDHIQLSAAIFTKLAGAANLADHFYDTSLGAQGANDFIVYNSLTGALYYDANGSAVGTGVQFATLTNTIVLTGFDLTLGA